RTPALGTQLIRLGKSFCVLKNNGALTHVKSAIEVKGPIDKQLLDSIQARLFLRIREERSSWPKLQQKFAKVRRAYADVRPIF
ncbi:MAG TPA: hypothetical protein VEG25_10145, partial [Burkholderiales bacterium]|nr:hypothetical protein [Burkholderiales bacterium]